MKIFIHTYSEPDVGIFSETIVLNWKTITKDFLDSVAFTNVKSIDTTQREYLRETLSNSFEDITSFPVTVKFEDENEI